MKFLCVPCDSPMTLRTVSPPDRGSLAVVYSCPECGYEIAMLTNAYETQVVQSLGVRIGPEAGVGSLSNTAANASDERDDNATKGSATSSAGCPFAAMIPSIETEREDTGPATSTGAEAAERASNSDEAKSPITLRWTADAEARLERVPAFVRPMARAGIERFARERGARQIDENVLDAAREFFGM